MGYEEDDWMDDFIKSSKNEKTCWNCKHLHANNISCDAFPSVIPIIYLTGEKEHTSAKRQSNEIVWELDEENKYQTFPLREPQPFKVAPTFLD